MSKKHRNDAAKASRFKKRLVSRAPEPIEPLEERGYAVLQRKASQTEIFDAQVKFERAALECQAAIWQAQVATGMTKERWAYAAKRWSEILWPSLMNAAGDCRTLGLEDPELKQVISKLKFIKHEWKLAREYRDNLAAADAVKIGDKAASPTRLEGRGAASCRSVFSQGSALRSSKWPALQENRRLAESRQARIG